MTVIAAIQMVSTDSLNDNLNQAKKLIAQAASLGAQFALLPENFAMFSAMHYWQLAVQEYRQRSIFNFLAEQCNLHNIWICGGTIPQLAPETTEPLPKSPNRIRAASLLINPNGDLVSRYDKIHLFNAEVEDAQKKYAESDYIEPGHQATVIETPIGKIGFSICYDLRFPELFRYMSRQGAQIFLVPSAFTEATGLAHWQVLLRARAIENLCYVVGANQGGQHSDKRSTFGHSCIIHPWGHILGALEKGPGVVIAEINLGQQQALRDKMPVLEHRTLFSTEPLDTE